MRARLFRCVLGLALLLGIAIISVLPFHARAESALWNYLIPEKLISTHYFGPGTSEYFFMTNTQVQIQYQADVVDANTGVSVCGSSIAKDTPLKASFKPYESNDI